MSNNGKIQTINPATGKVISTYDIMSLDQIEHIAKNAQNSFGNWKKKEILERCDYIRDLAKILSKNKSRYARIVTEEMGKPITQSIAEIEKCALVCEYYSDRRGIIKLCYSNIQNSLWEVRNFKGRSKDNLQGRTG